MSSPRSGLRILHVVRQFLPRWGGMQEYVAQLCAELTRMGHTVEVLTLDRNLHTGEKFEADSRVMFQKIEINVKRIAFCGGSRFFWIDRFNLNPDDYDIVHVHGLDSLLFRAINFSTRPLFISTHGGFFHTSQFRWLKHLWFRTLTAWQLEYVDKVLACSRQDFDRFSQICDHVTLIENGVDVEAFEPVKPFEKDLSHCLYVGGFQSHKRVDRLLKAFEYCHRHFPELRLSIVGEELYEGQWTDLTDQLLCKEALYYYPTLERPQLIELFRSSGIFWSASEYEGFGIAAMEGLASGNLLLLQSNEAFTDLFKNFAEFSDFQSPSKVLQSYRKLQSMNAQEYHQKIVKGLSKSNQYSWKRVAQEIENYYLSSLWR